MNSKDVFLYAVYFYHVHFCWLRCYVLIMFFDNSINNVCKYMACNPQIMCIIVATSGISSGVSGVIFLLYVYDGLYCTNSSCIHILQKNVVIMLFFFVAKFLLYAHYVNLIFGLAVSETCCNAGFVIC